MSLKDKYINPLTDFGFKKLFGIEPNKELLIDFLNQLLPPVHKVKNLSYTKNDHLSEEEKIQIAKEMKADGFPIEKIVKYTGLSKNDIEEL